MLDHSESVLMRKINQNSLNQSMDGLRKYPESAHSIHDRSAEIVKEKSIDQVIKPDVGGLLLIDKTETAIAKKKLLQKTEENVDESIKRSNIRGLEMMMSEKSNESIISRRSCVTKQESEETKTLKYETAERVQNSETNQNIERQMDRMYNQFDKIMNNCLTGSQEDDSQNVVNHEADVKGIISPLSSNVSVNSKPYESKSNTLNYSSHNNARSQAEEVKQNVPENLITPRDQKADSASYCYRTPTSDAIESHRSMNIVQNNANFQTIGSYESDRREDMYNNQFYTNPDSISRRDENDGDMHIYVDQWDEHSASKQKDDDLSSSGAMYHNESIGIHTAKNSPLESGCKDYERMQTSEDRYSFTEDSAEKNLSDAKQFGFKKDTSFNYVNPKFNNVKRNLHSTLQENIGNCLNSPNNDDFILSSSNVSQEVNVQRLPLAEAHKMMNKSYQQHPNYQDFDSDPIEKLYATATPRDTHQSPNGFGESKCVVLSNKK